MRLAKHRSKSRLTAGKARIINDEVDDEEHSIAKRQSGRRHRNGRALDIVDALALAARARANVVIAGSNAQKGSDTLAAIKKAVPERILVS